MRNPTETPLKVLDDAFIVYITSRTFRLHTVGMLSYILYIHRIIVLDIEIPCIIIPLIETVVYPVIIDPPEVIIELVYSKIQIMIINLTS